MGRPGIPVITRAWGCPQTPDCR